MSGAGDDTESAGGWADVKPKLLDQAPDVTVNNDIRIDYYFNSIQNYREQARQHIEQKDYERAFICLMRFANVASGTIPKHKDYKSDKYKRDRKRVKLQLENILETLERLADRLKNKYDNATQEEFDEDEAATAAAVAAAAATAVSADGEAKDESDAAAAGIVAGGVAAATADVANLIVPDADRWSNLRIPTPSAASVNGPRASSETVTKRVEAALSKQRIKVPLDLMDRFLQIAHPNTKKDVETCGILGGSLVGDTYQVTHLIIPRQEGTANTVVTYDEEKLIDIQLSKGLITLGWIHTHPSQTCFMSSVDLHTHYGYQVMLPEAIAIVMAPSKKKDSGVFSITTSGMKILETCARRGFHQHAESENVYGDAPHAEIDPGLQAIQIIQLSKIR